jgi:release factor glutamine methyltransferase
VADHRTRPWTILSLLNWTTSYFADREIESPRPAAEILLAHTLNLTRIDLYLRHDQPLTDPELKRFKRLIKRRLNREPVAYITGSKEFWSLEFHVSPEVLIPRPETECLVEMALPLTKRTGKRPRKVLELGTGSGAIVVALAVEVPMNRYIATDSSPGAILMAKRNATEHGCGEQIDFIRGDWFDPFKPETSRFDLILSNPPYIATDAIRQLEPEIKSFEPIKALDGDKDGLGCLRRIIQAAHRYLAPEGALILEMGFDQGEALKTIAVESGGYGSIDISKDYSGLDRIIRLERKATRSMED